MRSSIVIYLSMALGIALHLTGCSQCSTPGTSVSELPDGVVISFTEIGTPFPNKDLIDLEFLPGQGDEAIVIGKGGSVYYTAKGFAVLVGKTRIPVAQSGEQGLLNVAADPDYATNKFIYLYLTAPDGSQNQVDRFTVDVDVKVRTFSLTNRVGIIEFPKDNSPSPGRNHNGGGLIFDSAGRLIIGVGDGGGSGSTDLEAEIGQDPSTRLGKILRIIPSRAPGKGGFAIPTEGNSGPVDTFPEIFALGLRNPFTLGTRGNAIFIGDVGSNKYEEIDLADVAGLNFGWPFAEGNSKDVTFRNPLHGYAHGDVTFIKEDPQTSADARTSKSLMVGTFYQGSQYKGALKNRLIYNEFYAGWVRGLKLDQNNRVIDDRHLGQLPGMTSLQQGPNDFLYAVSLFKSNRILKMELAE